MSRTSAAKAHTPLAAAPLVEATTLTFPTPLTRAQARRKRAFDLVLSLVALAIAAPVMLLIAALIATEGKGHIIFRQRRHGLDSAEFDILKFRSMRISSDSLAQAQRDDHRVTLIGRILRRTSLDELPQLFNVLRGEMSLVGPRPHAVAHTHYYSKLIESYEARLHMRPGVTGWAQVNGWRGETDTLEKMRKRVEHDLYYVQHWSLWFDLRILLRTVATVLLHKNAY